MLSSKHYGAITLSTRYLWGNVESVRRNTTNWSRQSFHPESFGIDIYRDKIHSHEIVRQYFWREKNGFVKITQKKIKNHESTLNVKKLLESCPHQKIPFFFVK